MADIDHFALLGQPRRFAVDTEVAARAHQELLRRVHPDRFANASPAERRVAQMWAGRANEALFTLKDPVRRALYLARLEGHPIETEGGAAVAPEFLMQQMEWREALGEARVAGDLDAMEALLSEVLAQRTEALEALGSAIDGQHDWTAAADLVRRLMFTEKFCAELNGAIENH